MKQMHIRRQLILYDILVFLAVELILLIQAVPKTDMTVNEMLLHMVITFVCVFTARFIGLIYRQIWRYGGIQCYIRLLIADGMAFVVNVILEMLIPSNRLSFTKILAICALNLLISLAIRMFYRYAYKCCDDETKKGKFLKKVLRIFGGGHIRGQKKSGKIMIPIAIVGAGTVGVAFAEELISSPNARYTPRCFVDNNPKKVGRRIFDLPVIFEDEHLYELLRNREIKEVVIAIPDISFEARKKLFEQYRSNGFDVKIYDYPVTRIADGKRHLREFNIEELLFRSPVDMLNEKTCAYYKDKVVLVTGGGGSIGSELCRQLSRMEPKKIIVLDIYENGAYDLQQELRILYKKQLDICIEIVSITNKEGLKKVFELHKPDIVINAAAHKHVPLMEHNCVEAVENNVFGTENLIELCEEFKVERFMMVSTDKAVNPTNVMGATKRMCEILVQYASTKGTVKYSATRFGNVLGSAGSVIPLFKRQIANGGPLTITDKRITRYFMTIPEAAQLVLQSGMMANNGELFVLDMGQPVKIYDLAKNIIELSGVQGIEIEEIGLRPGEKLYEELLVKTEELDKTENSLIFIERDQPCTDEELIQKMEILHKACDSLNDLEVKEALKQVVPTYKSSEVVNGEIQN